MLWVFAPVVRVKKISTLPVGIKAGKIAYLTTMYPEFAVGARGSRELR